MLPHYLLGKTFECDCGRIHSVPLQAYIYSSNALERLPKLLSHAVPAGSPVCVIADARTYEAAGYRVGEMLEGDWNAQTVILDDGPQGGPVCDDITRDRLLSTIGDSWDALLAVGSGVVNDLCKWIASTAEKPYLAVATAASMNGYASSNIAPSIKGVKRVLEGNVPFGVVALPDVIEEAPFELTTAGLGDVLAKPVSIADWHVNHIIFNEYYCPLCSQLIEDLEPLYMNSPHGIRAKDPETIKALFSALVYSGVSMTMAETSFPASGGEHLVSHVLDMKAMHENRGHELHGRQVGIGTIFAAALYERLLQMEAPDFEPVTEETDAAYWKSLAGVVEEEHARKREKIAIAVDRLREGNRWDTVREAIAGHAVEASAIKTCLSKAGAAHCLDHIGVSKADFLNAVMHSHQIRERYTVIDLARAAGVLPAAANDIANEFLGG